MRQRRTDKNETKLQISSLRVKVKNTNDTKCTWCELICWFMKIYCLFMIGSLLLLLLFVSVMSWIDSKSEVVEIASKWNENIVNSKQEEDYDYNEDYVSDNFKVYVIMSESRREYIENEISKTLKWDSDSVTYINGLDANEFDSNALVEAGLISREISEFYPGRVACVLSHKKALEAFLLDDSGAQKALIVEDDIQLNPLLNESPDVYINAIMDVIPTGWNFINFGRCWDWCYSDSYIENSNSFVVDSLNPTCTHIYAVTKDGAYQIVKDLLPLQSLNIDQIIVRMIRAEKLTGYSSSIPVLLQNKKKTGSLAAPAIEYPYRMCAKWYQEVLSRLVDTDLLSSLWSSSDGLLSGDGLVDSLGGFLSSDGIELNSLSKNDDILTDGADGLGSLATDKPISYQDGLGSLATDKPISFRDGLGSLATDKPIISYNDGLGSLATKPPPSYEDGLGASATRPPPALSYDTSRLLTKDGLLRLLQYLFFNGKEKGDLYY